MTCVAISASENPSSLSTGDGVTGVGSAFVVGVDGVGSSSNGCFGSGNGLSEKPLSGDDTDSLVSSNGRRCKSHTSLLS